MQIIILSGGSGTRLWPLSNDARSKQFLRILPIKGSEERESMIQRVVRQIKESDLNADITVATSISQRDAVSTQVGDDVSIVTEPSRRRTFPAICLACEYLAKVKRCDEDETVIVMPCDPFTHAGFFNAIAKMARGIEENLYKLILLGITPTYPSTKYGYIMPLKNLEKNKIKDIEDNRNEGIYPVEAFREKPEKTVAEHLIERGGLWNAGVFAMKLGFMMDISKKYANYTSYQEYLNNYEKFPKISFDYEVVEKTASLGMVVYDGYWKDLGTWNTLTDELDIRYYGNVVTDGTSENTHIFNELNLPLLCIGTKDLVIAASPDGIIVSEKSKSENVKKYVGEMKARPMFEERRW